MKVFEFQVVVQAREKHFGGHLIPPFRQIIRELRVQFPLR